MLKWFGRLLVLGIIVFFCLGLFAYFSLKQTQPPGIDKAQWAVQAYVEQAGVKFPTRYYYAESVQIVDGNALLTTYWTFDGKRYHKVTGDRVIVPPFKVLRRKG